jgi:hypothetical protein
MNKTYVAIRPIPRRGHTYQPGDEVPIAHDLPNWRRHQIDAGNLKELPAVGPLDLAAMNVGAVAKYVADVEDVEELRALAVQEQEGKGRSTAVEAIMARIDVLVPGDDEGDE